MSRRKPQPETDSLAAYRPLARTEDLERSYADHKVLLYDKRTHYIHYLDEEVTSVWHHCDGMRDDGSISIKTGIAFDRVAAALVELDTCGLLQSGPPRKTSMRRMSRRTMARLGMAALPAIVSVSAPTAKAAASGASATCVDRFGGCNYDSDCCPPTFEGYESFCLGGYGGVCDIQRSSS